MREAIKRGNKNISLTTMGLKHKKYKQKVKNLDPLNVGDGLQTPVILKEGSTMADIPIYHVENNVVIDTQINKAIKQSNELIRIANLSYYHQSKSEFTLCNKELKLLKICNISLPRACQDSSKSYFKSREF